MKKIPFIKLFILCFCIGVLAATVSCTKKEEETTTTENEQVEDNTQGSDQEEQQEENKEPDTLKLTETDALQLVNEKLDMEKYTTEVINTSLQANGSEYIVVLVSDDMISYEPALAVDVYSGEILCYYPDETFAPFSEFPLAGENEKEVTWNGVYQKADDTGDMLLEIMMSDPTSFEFTITYQQNQTFTAVARIETGTAVYEDENGYGITFYPQDGNMNLVESGENPKGTSFAGLYELASYDL